MPKLYRERHQKMLDLQDEIRPFTPTVRELMEAWGLNSTSVVHRTLTKLEESGLVITREMGPGKKYYAIEQAIRERS